MASSSSRLVTALPRLAASSSSSLAATRCVSTASTSASTSSPAPLAVPSRTYLPKANIEVGPTQLNRLAEHYYNTLASDLLYMTYEHPSASAPSQAQDEDRVRRWDPNDPYSKLRPARAPRGNRRIAPRGKDPLRYDAAKDLVKLDRVVLTAFSKEAITSKHSLVTLVAQLRAITGLSVLGSNADPSLAALDASHASPSSLSPSAAKGYVRILKARTGAASFKIRPGMPVGAQAVLPGPAALEFLEILSTFVLPRLRTFSGFLLPPASQPPSSAAALSGVVSLGMAPEAMALFPQTEINWDAYPGKGLGFQIDCITNQRGPRATERARQLLSGFGIPFVRRG